MQRKRINWIDELKGAVLVMICLGHISGMVFTPPIIKLTADILTMIGVPVFFFLSGILFTGKETSTKQYILNKTKSLFIPYILLSLLFTVLDPYTYNSTYLIEELNYPRFTIPSSLVIPKDIQASLEFFLGDIVCTLSGISSRATLPLWFVFVLYFVSITYKAAYLLFKSEIAMALLAFFALSLAMWLDRHGIGGYLKIGPILMALFFFWFGTIVSSRLYMIEGKKSVILLFLSIPLLGLCSISAPQLLSVVGFVNGCFASEIPLNFISFSFAGTVGLMLLFIVISKIQVIGINELKGILRNIGRNSLIILASHYYLLCVFSLFIKRLIPLEWHFISTLIFVTIGCIASIVVFRTRLYMFIGGRRTKQAITTCLSIK